MTRVAVLGLGLIGGSLALAVRARAYDRDPGVREAARARGLEVADSITEAVRGCDVVVAAVPTSATGEVLRAAAAARPEAVLTDVASLKRPIAALAAQLPDGARLVGGHPMVGSTARGFAAADPALFRDRAWLVVPTARSDAAAMSAVGELARAAGARPLVLSVERHDALMTLASHLPLAAAAALARVAASEGGDALGRVAGPGLLDATRLAATERDLALELLLGDPARLAAALRALSGELEALARALERDDVAEVVALLDAARAARAQLVEASEDSTAK